MDLPKKYREGLSSGINNVSIIELSLADLREFDTENGVETAFSLGCDIYNRDLSNAMYRNVIYIDGDNNIKKSQTYLLDAIIDTIQDPLKKIKNLETLEKTLTAVLATASGGILGSYNLEGLTNTIANAAGEKFSEIISKMGVYKSANTLESGVLKKHDGEATFDEAINKRLYLTSEAKKVLGVIYDQEITKESVSPADVFRIVLNILSAISIGSSKLLFIKNPHKLDTNSIAILSLVVSMAKHTKGHEDVSALSIVYAYEDPVFQPYKKVEDSYIPQKKLLDEQRLFALRYGVLERLSSDIPTMAVKSTMFVGRKDEINQLVESYEYSINNPKKSSVMIISGEPGIGKTTLIKKHIDEIRSIHGEKVIELTLLNQTGHTSSNTGISSLQNSIMQEAERLERLKDLTTKASDFAKKMAKDSIASAIKNLFGGNWIDVGIAVDKGIWVAQEFSNMKINGSGNLDDHDKNSKENTFLTLDHTIRKLQTLSDSLLPIILFVDDLQWIDAISSEYILEHMMQQFNLHIVSTYRPSDAATILKTLKEKPQYSSHQISFLSMGLTGHEEEENLKSETLHLRGLDNQTLQELTTQIIEGSDSNHSIFVKEIAQALKDNSDGSVNTLFAVETINMLCDERFYSHIEKEKQLILTDKLLRFNPEIKDFEKVIRDTFNTLQQKHDDALAHYNKSNKNANHQKFNLMAYAVLEERMNLLQEYFREYGNAAVNTLLLSSLLGVPFNVAIIQNILKRISETDDELLRPLKYKITQDSQEIYLKPEHYLIIEEVYEILNRYAMFDETFEHKHSLLTLFLEKQLDYELELHFGKASDNPRAYDNFYVLILNGILSELQKQSFYHMPKQSLTSKEYQERLFFLKAMLKVYKSAFSNNPYLWAEDYTNALNNLAVSYKAINRLDEAIELQEKNLRILESLYQKDSDRWGDNYTTALNNMGMFYKDINRLGEAIELQEKNLRILESLYQKDSDRWGKNYTTVLNNLSGLYQDKNYSVEAIELLEKSLQILETLYQKDPDRWVDNYTTVLNGLGILYTGKNPPDEAIVLLEKSLRILESLYQKSPDRWGDDYTTALNNLAISYAEKDLHDKAIELLKKCLKIRESLYLKDPDRWGGVYTTTLNNLAASYIAKKRLKEANELLDQSMRILETMYQKSPDRWAKDYMIALNNLAVSHSHKNHPDEAIELLEKSLEILETMYQKDPDSWAKDYMMILNKLAVSYAGKKRSDKAIEFEEKSLYILEEYYASDHDEWRNRYALTLNSLGSSYINAEKFTQASEYFKRYFDTYAFSQSEDITYFIYPFVKLYQCEEHIGDEIEIKKLIKLANELKDIYRQTLGTRYPEKMEEVHQNYQSIRDSVEPMEKEKYLIFKKIFVDGAN